MIISIWSNLNLQKMKFCAQILPQVQKPQHNQLIINKNSRKN